MQIFQAQKAVCLSTLTFKKEWNSFRLTSWLVVILENTPRWIQVKPSLYIDKSLPKNHSSKGELFRNTISEEVTGIGSPMFQHR